MMLAFKEAQRLDSNFEERAINVVESEETDEGCQRRTSTGKRPIGNQIKFGLSRAIAIRSDVMANMLYAIREKLALLQLKGNTILQKNITDTFE